ncbi:hypothetical protein Pmani_000509 [Petrolisthes manimaculis]|uniref:Uncharacterized protein n=1 Tax=Petrolisthes manimaculis TaxID=1843537 RepID=A0AAE1QPY9_9EUCA|nr:hypothetical protein Pmani_000509 [Petrolisthes manimaculis]
MMWEKFGGVADNAVLVHRDIGNNSQTQTSGSLFYKVVFATDDKSICFDPIPTKHKIGVEVTGFILPHHYLIALVAITPNNTERVEGEEGRPTTTAALQV